MAERYLIDTNISIYYVDGNLTENANVLLVSIFYEEILLSVISEIEILGFNPKVADDYHRLEDFIKQATVLGLTDDIKLKTIQLRKENKIKLPDAIIAATALVHKLTLITHNKKDFLKIQDLKIIDPFNL